MKKLYLASAMLMLLGISGCSTKENGVTDYFLEPDGYIIATVEYGEKGLFGYSEAYGYISEENYEAYLSGELDGALVILHPWEDGKSVSVDAKSIAIIGIGEYKQKR